MATGGTVTHNMALALLVDLHDRLDEEKGYFSLSFAQHRPHPKLALPKVFEKSGSLRFRKGPLKSVFWATNEA